MPLQYPQQQQQPYGFAMPAPPMQWNMAPQAFIPPAQGRPLYTHNSRPSHAQRNGHGKSPSFQYSGGFALRSASISRPAGVKMPIAPDVPAAPFIPQYQHQNGMRPYQPHRFNPQIPRFEPTAQRPTGPPQFLSPTSSVMNRSESGSRSPISPSIRSSAVSPANANYTPEGLPIKQHVNVKLCKEDTKHRRIAMDPGDWPEWVVLDGLELVSREVHEDEVPRDE